MKPNPLNYTVAMEITTQKEADDYFEKLVRWAIKESGKSKAEVERIQRTNLGYFAGYYDSKTQRRVQKLFNCEHPIFGSIEKNGEPTSEQALQAGIKMGKKLKRKLPT